MKHSFHVAALCVALLTPFAGMGQSAPAVLRLPKSDTPPSIPPQDAQFFTGGVYSSTTNGTNARLCVTPDGQAWQCMPTASDMAAANAAQDTSIASTYMPTATANAAIATMQSSISGNSTSISGLTTRVDTLESQVETVQGAATAAQTTANAAASAASTNASAISALSARVTAAEAAITALQALPKRLCASFTVAAGVSVPLTGISTVQNVTLAGVPVGAVCDTGAPTRMPLGARPDPVVTTAGTVAMAFVSNAGLLSSVISIPSGTYKVCCDSF